MHAPNLSDGPLTRFLGSLRSPAIAVVDLQGTIGGAVRPLEYTRLLSRLGAEPSVRAVVLNIDSPGGVASGAELITRAVERLNAAKPVVSFIAGTGASGGYMIACASRHVVALPSAIVGAIGVISYRPVVEQALERLGVQMLVAKSGRLKDMGSPFREPTEEEQARQQHLLDSLYDLFVESVARGRGLPLERVRELATGEVYTTAEALEHGLVDSVGDLEDAVDWAAKESGAPRRVRVVRPRRTLRDLMLGRAAAALAQSVLAELDAAAAGGGHYLYTGPTGGR